MDVADQQAQPTSLDEIRVLASRLPGPDKDAARKAAQREVELTKPAGSLGRLEELSEWLAAWQGHYPPRLRRARTAVFAGNHGIASHGVSAYPAQVTRQMVENFINGGAAINQLCIVMDADLRIYELDIDHPTADFTKEPAMSSEDCAKAMAYGMMAVDEGLDVLCLGEMGIGNTTSAAALCLGLFGGKAADWVGPGTGVGGKALQAKLRVVAAGIERHGTSAKDPLDLLTAVGGLELAAIVGAILAARMARTPVLLDGYACTAAAAILQTLQPQALDHCQVGHVSAEPGHRRLLEILGKKPLLDLGMRLGEASGATLALALLKAAVSCHTTMATFEQANISGPSQNIKSTRAK